MSEFAVNTEKESQEEALDESISAGGSPSKSKNKKKKSKSPVNGGALDNAVTDSATTHHAADISHMDLSALTKYIRDVEIQKQKEKYLRKVKTEDDYKFWNTQPGIALINFFISLLPHSPELVLKMKETFNDNEDVVGPIEMNEKVGDVKPEPYNMPAGFVWCSLDVKDPVQLQEIYKLLTENYVEDDDAQFRFDYSVEFLQWALTPPGYYADWHVGVRTEKTGKLMGCITGIPADIKVHDAVRKMAEINFLCVHKKLRTKRLAPILIKEITRRVNLTNRWQAVYTAGVLLPKPISKCRYYHRSLNPKKLIAIKFSSLPPRVTLTEQIKKYNLPKQTKYPFRSMVASDGPGVHALLTKYLNGKKLHQEFNVDEVVHVFTTISNVVESYVIETDGKITDFCSFYHLPSTVIGHTEYSKLNAVYSYYNIATTVPLTELMNDALILAKNSNADVYNCLDLCDNKQVLEPLLFGAGDGNLHYYVFNWKCPQLEPPEVGLVLL